MGAARRPGYNRPARSRTSLDPLPNKPQKRNTGAAVKAIDLRPGNAIDENGRLFVVTKFEHRTPGNLRAFIQVKLKDVQTGQHIEKRLNPADELTATTLDRRTVEYLYQDADGYVFMDTSSYEQFTLDEDTVGESMQFLRPNATTAMLFHGEKAILVELPPAVELVVADCQPGIKGATATNQLKEAVMETGLKTRVPPFIEVGETLKIATSDASYMSRAKE